MSCSFIDASNTKKEKNIEKSLVNMEFHITLCFDGLTNDNQTEIRDSFRMNKKISFIPRKGDLISSFCENPNVEQSPNKELENDVIKHIQYTINLKSYNETRNSYINQIKLTKNLIKEKINQYALNTNIEHIKLFFYITTYNQGDFFTNFLTSLNIFDDDDQLEKEIKKLLNFHDIFSNNKVSSAALLSLNTFDVIAHAEIQEGQNVLKIITDNCDLLKEQKEAHSNLDNPSEDNISVFDAVVMCEHTYKSQTPIERSIPDAFFSFFSKNKKSENKEEENVKIKVDKVVAENVKSNNFKIDQKNDSYWVPTKSKWVSVSNDDAIIAKNKIHLKSAVSGFYSKLYEQKCIGNNNEEETKSYAYCTAGTNITSINDWLFTNVLQGCLGISLQYTQSVRNARKLDEYCKMHKKPLFFIGHSLGGGLASNNALVTKSRHAITFNAAGLCPFRIAATLLINNHGESFNLKSRKSRIHPFIIEGEMLDSLQKNIATPIQRYNPILDVEDRDMRATGIDHAKIFSKNLKIKLKDGDEDSIFGDMSSKERHTIINFLRLKDLANLKIEY